MGNCGPQASKEDLKTSSTIDSNLRKQKKTIGEEIKLLLLGAGDSGKSTFAKQMKILFLEGFSDDERRPYKEVIHSNVILSIRMILLFLQRTDPDKLSAPELKAEVDLLTSGDILFEEEITPELRDAIMKVWALEATKKSFENKGNLQVIDTASYYFDHVERLADSDYIPSIQDILLSRARTTGIVEIQFTTQEGVRFRMVDVGGQRSERKKWIHCFQDVTSIIFFVSMSEYNLSLTEDAAVNRMHESLLLFEEICSCPWFDGKSIILFLNKVDLFKEKIQKVDLNVCFKEYTGGLEYNAASTYMKEQFCKAAKEKKVYCHFTMATDTENISFVFSAIRDIVVRAMIDANFSK